MADGKVAPVALIAAELEYHIADKIILAGVSLSIHDGDRIGLIGRNGTGKTTLLKLLAGVEMPYGGEITSRRNLTMGYLPQTVRPVAGHTVRHTILDGARALMQARHEFEAAGVSPERHHELELFINAHNGWNLEPRMEALSDTLQVPDLDRDVENLSGGEQRRVMLCRALISQPDLLILDEPTNHLDTDSIEWLEQFLVSYAGSCITVTHDRYFLDNVTTRIFELATAGLEAYSGNYSDYLADKEGRLQVAESKEAKRQAFLKREQEWLRRGPKARTTKAQYRVDRFYEISGQRGLQREADVDLVLPPAGYQNDVVIETAKLGMSIAGKHLFSDLNLRLEPGHKFAVIGRNGVGKTTLLRLILGEMTPTEGSIKVGTQTHMNYIDQRRVQLNDDNSVYEEIAEGKETVRLGRHNLTVHSYLGRFLFNDRAIYSKVGMLSGGERSRLLMAKQLKHGGNLLLLDEPTNDLDLPTLRILEEALANFDGCVLVVSHDRYFLNRICTHVLAIEDAGHVTVMPGDYDYYIQKRTLRARPAVVENEEDEPVAPRVEDKGPRKLKWKEERELEAMEQNIAAAEAEVQRLEAIFSNPDFYNKYGEQAGVLTDELNAAKAKVEQLFQRWEELEAIRTKAQV